MKIVNSLNSTHHYSHVTAFSSPEYVIKQVAPNGIHMQIWVSRVLSMNGSFCCRIAYEILIQNFRNVIT
ncbi:CLUMA_CG014216, isoform A [Clunio marinus]|uniref:CLUMA_CG014216, isoform A n=1 Tax=Clunio marinus TaxID=568069 RepID=A0A1J1INE4_9DIPT|nr:CLUMA_CG014216, isoform A [Clunio marinus]